MLITAGRDFFRHLTAGGAYPPQAAFLLDTPLRNVLLSPRGHAARLPLEAHSRVLEIGAGSAYYSAEIARRVPDGHLELLDSQAEMLDLAKRNLAANNFTNVGYTVTDAGELPFADDSFDVVFMVLVLGEIENQTAFLRETKRIMKPAGTLSITEYLPDRDFKPFGEVCETVTNNGFTLSVKHGWRWNYTANFHANQ